MGKLERWRLRLQELEFDVVHRPGPQQIVPDALLRLPTPDHDTTPIDDDVPVFSLTIQTIRFTHRFITNQANIWSLLTEMEKDAKDTPTTLRVLCDDEADILNFRKEQNIETKEDNPVLREVMLEAQRSD